MTATTPRLPNLIAGQPTLRGRTDGAALVQLFVTVLMIIPARLIVRGLPLSLTPANILALLATMCWLCAQLTCNLGAAKGRTPVRTSLFCYVVALMASYGLATAGYVPGDELKLADHALVLVIAQVGIALAVCDGVRGLDRLDALLKRVVACGTVVAGIGGIQFLSGVDLTTYLMKIPGLREGTEGGTVEARSDMARVMATTGHPIEFGVLCSMLLPLAVHYGWQAKDRGQPSLRWWLCAGTIGGGLMFSISRSAILGVGAVGVVMLLGWPVKRRLQAFAISLVFLAGTKVVAPGLLGTLYGLFANFGNDTSVQYRQHRYQIAQDELLKHFWLGRGIGTWYVPKYIAFDNQWIHTAIEAGAIGVTAFAMIFLTGIYASLRARFMTTDSNQRDLAQSLVACLVVPLVAAATFDLLSFSIVTGLSFLLVGAAGALYREVVQTDPDTRLRFTASFRRVAARRSR